MGTVWLKNIQNIFFEKSRNIKKYIYLNLWRKIFRFLKYVTQIVVKLFWKNKLLPTKVPVFYCFKEKIQITKFLPKIIFTYFDQSWPNSLRFIENHEKNGKNLVIWIFSLNSNKQGLYLHCGSLFLVSICKFFRMNLIFDIETYTSLILKGWRRI